MNEERSTQNALCADTSLFGNPAIRCRKNFGGPVVLRPGIASGLLLSEECKVTID